MDWTTIRNAIWTWVQASSELPAGSVIWKYGSLARPTAPFIEMSILDMRQVAHDYVTHDDNVLVVPTTPVVPVVSGNTFTATTHPYVTGDGPFTMTSSGTFPTPIVALENVWVIVIDANTIRLATTFQNAMNTVPITLTGAGSGTIQLVPSDDTFRAGIELVQTAHGTRECTLELQCFGVEGSVDVAQQLLTNVLISLSLYADNLNIAGVGVTDLGVAYINGGVRLLEGRRGSILEPRAICEVTFYANVTATNLFTFVETVQLAVKPQAPDGTPLPEHDYTIGS